MRFLSVCSGIEAASVAWEPLGWEAVAFSEVDAFASAVLAHRYPNVPNLGDMTKFEEWPDEPVDLLVGGTPCQSFSIAGLRKGLADPRGNLMLTFGAIAAKYRPSWVVWENVPGVLSSNRGRDFGTFLGMLGELGYGTAYRVLDAQFFGVAQRRRRVFVVGYIGDWRRAAAVLFERDSLSGNPAPSRKAGKGFAADPAPSLVGSGRGVARTGESRGQDSVVATFDRQSTGEYGVDPVASTMAARDYKSPSDLVVEAQAVAVCATGDRSHALTSRHDSSEDGTGRGVPTVAQSVSLRGRDGGATAELGGDFATALRASSGGGDKAHVLVPMAVRRLTPRECERLQGFPDDHTLVPVRGKPAADGPRYKTLGNSMAVPVMRWLGRRIDLIRHLGAS